jgi:hypothetical protein
LTGQLASGASVLPQAVVLTEYCPVVTKVGTGSGPAARLVSVNVCVAEAPTSRFPKLSEVPESEKPGVPVPVSEAVSESP